MFTITKEIINWGGRQLILETGLIARQADGAVLVTYGETQVLCTVVFQKKGVPGQKFFPLTVNYQEKAFAAGKIPGGFLKREGRPSEQEILISRLIDRSIRPLFPETFHNEVQVIATVLAYDGRNSPDIPAMIGSSAALVLSGVPFLGPIASAHVGYKNNEYILNPTIDQETDLQLIVSGTRTGVLMVESEAKELSEDVMLKAIMFGWKSLQEIINAIIRMAEKSAKDPYEIKQDESYPTLLMHVRNQFEKAVMQGYRIVDKKERTLYLEDLQDKVVSVFSEEENALKALEDVAYDVMRTMILNTKRRIDGRGLMDIRPIDCRVSIVNRVHGSALFTRGETQALVVATLGTTQDEQIMDTLEGEGRLRFMLHYNFPPYSVGEIGRLGTPGRREIGHGKLAWRAIHPLLPLKEKFFYTLRLVSEITESNGSSSMATVCGSSLALMDAGVPLVRPCAGIAMGLIKEGDSVVVLSDILGDEDHLGDMDFKVAGTELGITALQMDIKIVSVTEEILKIALEQAKPGRLFILNEMNKILSSARETLSDFAPRVDTFLVPKDKIREIIGSGGKVIREICETTGAKIDITDDGQVTVSSVDKSKLDLAVNIIQNIVAEIEMGKIYHGKVVKIMNFGAFVNCVGAHDGLVHVSEISDKRVEKVEDFLQVGQMVWAKCLDIDRARNRVKLSMKCVDQTTGKEIPCRTEEH